MLGISESLAALLISLFFMQFLKLQRARSQLPPGPTPLPIIGNLWVIGFQLQHETLIKVISFCPPPCPTSQCMNLNNCSDLLLYMTLWNTQEALECFPLKKWVFQGIPAHFILLAGIYGNIFTLWMGHTPLIILNGFRTVKDVLTVHAEDVSGRPSTPFFQKSAGGKGIVFANGHTWKQQRRFGMMTLRRLGLGKEGLEHRIQEEARHLVEYLMHEGGQPLDPSFRIVHCVSNVLAAVIFGHRFSIEDTNFHQLIKVGDYLTQNGNGIIHMLYNVFPRLMNHLPGPHQKVFCYQEFIRSFVRKEIKSHQEKGSPDEPQDYIDFYLAQIDISKDDPSSTFDEENLVQAIFDLFLAGTETVVSSLRWALLDLVVHPHIQEKVQKELDSVLGPSQLICYEDRKKLPYTNAVIHETMRCSPAIGFGVGMQCIKDTVLQGFPIEKGTIVMPNLNSVLLDPEQWETPRRFNPKHFLDEDGNFVNKEAFLPFSAGHRVCLGEQLARIEFFLMFSNLLRKFTFRLPDGVTEINTEAIMGFTLSPHPYKICAVPR